MTIEQTMPASTDAERAILGAILLDNTTYHQAAQRLLANDFSLDSHRRIYLRMTELGESGKGIDFVTLTEQLGLHSEIESVGGTVYVMSLTDGLPRVKNIDQYVRIVKDKALLRGLIHVSNANAAAAYDQAESAQSIIARSLDQILTLQAGGAEEPQPISEFSDEVIASLMNSWNNREQINRYTLAVPELTEKTGGMLAQEYGVLIGRTGDGKTALASQIALENGLRGKPVLFFPLELSRGVMLKRMICQIARISNRTVIKHAHEPLASEFERIAYAKKILDAAPIYFDDSQELTIAQLVAKARQWKRRHCEKGDDGLVIVDYVQKISSKLKEMRDRMTAVSEGLRRLAKDENTRVLALSQMGRPEGKNMNARPTKFDPKESGSLENDAHLLVSAYRPVNENKMPTGADELVICKQRDGELGIVPVEYRGEYYTFLPRTEVG